MKLPRLLFVCFAAALLGGCAAFKSPNASQETRNERNAARAEERRATEEQDRAVDRRAAEYQRQGMSEAQARSAAEVGRTGPKASWP